MAPTPDWELITMSDSDSDESLEDDEPSDWQATSPIIRASQLSEVRKTRRVTCGGKPMSFTARYRGRSYFFKPAVRQSGSVQLLADLLKPLFGLEKMGVRLVMGAFRMAERTRLKGRQYVTNAPAMAYIMAPKSDIVTLKSVAGWQSRPGLMREYVKIGLFRYGTYRFSDFSTCNVQFKPNSGRLLSIDECGVNRASAFGARPRKDVAEYVAGHKAQLESMIRGWRAMARRSEGRLRKIVLRCGMPASVVGEIQSHLHTLNPMGTT